MPFFSSLCPSNTYSSNISGIKFSWDLLIKGRLSSINSNDGSFYCLLLAIIKIQFDDYWLDFLNTGYYDRRNWQYSSGASKKPPCRRKNRRNPPVLRSGTRLNPNHLEFFGGFFEIFGDFSGLIMINNWINNSHLTSSPNPNHFFWIDLYKLYKILNLLNT